MNEFTIILPIRGTERELKFMDKSIPSAIKMEPGEIIFACDDPCPLEAKAKILKIVKEHDFKNYRIEFFKKDPAWGFQLANVIWQVYQMAKYDKILSFDVDCSLRDDIMIGYDIVGKDNVAVCSFTKKILRNSILDLQRYIFYRLRVRQSDYVFSGIYWVWRPYYFKNMNKKAYMEIQNGVDTIMTREILKNDTHKIVTRKEMGCNSHDLGNEDYPWRQFQTGVWIQANHKVSLRGTMFKKPNKSNWRNWRKFSIHGLAGALIGYPMYVMMPALFRYLSSKGWGPFCFVLSKAFMYGHPHIISGYRWAKKHPEHEAVKLADGMDFDEWGYLGGKIMKMIGKKWKRMDGTGFEENIVSNTSGSGLK